MKISDRIRDLRYGKFIGTRRLYGDPNHLPSYVGTYFVFNRKTIFKSKHDLKCDWLHDRRKFLDLEGKNLL